MEVPFEQLGPGQSGRLAYQVMGKDGPILNPTNIRFMPPDRFTGQFISTGPAALLGLAGLNLAATCGALAMQAATLRWINEVRGQLDVVSAQMDTIAHDVRDLLRRVERIDTKVAE